MVENLFLEVIRSFYSYCHDVLGSDLKLSYTQSGNPLIRYELNFHILSHSPGPSPLLFSKSHAVLRGWAGHCSEHPWQRLPSNREGRLAWPLPRLRQSVSSSRGHLISWTQVMSPREKRSWKMGERKFRNNGEKRPRQDTEGWARC